MALAVIVEATPWDPATGAPIPIRLAGGGRRHYTYKGRTDWLGGVVELPKLTAQLGFGQSGFTGGAIPQVGAINFVPSRRDTARRLSRLLWTDAAVTVSVADDEVDAPIWTIVLRGTIAGYATEGQSFTWTLSDLAGSLAKPITSGTFAGTGGAEGIVEARGRPKRRSWGRVWNLEARLLDKAANVYELGDPARALHAIDAVKDRGREGPLAIVAWAGSVANTLAALVASQAPAGGAAIAPSIACVKWWTTPGGPLTADIRGEIGTGYVDTVPLIAAVIAQTAGVQAPAGLAAIAAARTAVAGVHVDEITATAADVLDRLCVGASLAWSIDPAGALRLLPIEIGDPFDTVVAVDVAREAAYAPITSVSVGYRRNNRKHTDAELSAAITAEDLTYADGTPFEDLKPAMPAATAGAPGNSPIGGTIDQDGNLVGARPAKEVLQDLSTNTLAILAEALRQDDLTLVLQRMTYVDGQPVGTFVLQFRNEQEAINAARLTDLKFFGTRNAEGTAWLLNLATLVTVDEDGNQVTLARVLDEIGVAAKDAKASTTILREALINDGDGFANAVIRSDADGLFAAVALTADGAQKLSRITLSASEVYFLDGNRENPIQLLSYVNGRWEFAGEIYAKKIVADSIETANIKAGAVTGLNSYSFPSRAVSAAEQSLLEVTEIVLGDSVDGRGIAFVSFVQDGTAGAENGTRIRTYVDVGTGYQLVRSQLQGARVKDGDIRYSFPMAFPVSLFGAPKVNLKITIQGETIGGGANSTGTTLSSVQLDIFTGAR